MFEIGGKPGWWSLLLLVPVLNFIALIIFILAAIEISKRFGKSDAFVLLLILLPVIGYPILAFGKSVYNDGSVNPPTVGNPNNNPPSEAYSPSAVPTVNQFQPASYSQQTNVQNPISKNTQTTNPMMPSSENGSFVNPVVPTNGQMPVNQSPMNQDYESLNQNNINQPPASV